MFGGLRQVLAVREAWWYAFFKKKTFGASEKGPVCIAL